MITRLEFDYKRWFWTLLALSLILLVMSIFVLQFEKKQIRVEILLSSIVLYSTLLTGTIPYFINNIYNRNDFSSKTSLVFYIFIIIFCISAIVFNAKLANKINNKKERKYESVLIVILSSILFLLYFINLIIETKIYMSIHNTVQNLKGYRIKQQDVFEQTNGSIEVNTKEGDNIPHPLYIRKEEGSTTTKNGRSIFSTMKKYWKGDDQHQFIKTGTRIHGNSAYIRIKKGEIVSFQVPSGSEGTVGFASI